MTNVFKTKLLLLAAFKPLLSWLIAPNYYNFALNGGLPGHLAAEASSGKKRGLKSYEINPDTVHLTLPLNLRLFFKSSVISALF